MVRLLYVEFVQYLRADWRSRQEMQKLLSTGKVKNIGVSNFQIRHLEKLLNDPSCKVVPAVNQIELHPANPSYVDTLFCLALQSNPFDRSRLLEYCRSKSIHCTAYSCLGGATDNPLFADPVLSRIAGTTKKTPAQIL